MATLKTAYVRPSKSDNRWREMDISDDPIHSLTAMYKNIALVINYQGVDDDYLVNFDELPNSYWENTDGSLTVSEWVDQLGDKTIPYKKGTISHTSSYVEYGQLLQYGYDVDPIFRNGSIDETEATPSAKEDLYVRKEGLEGDVIGSQALFSINGYFHLHDYDKNAVTIIDGNKTVNNNCVDCEGSEVNVGIHSFANVGKVKLVPITLDMLSTPGDRFKYRHGTYVTLPESVDLSGKTVMMVIGGYLQFNDNTFLRTGVRTFKVDPQRLSLLERYFTSRNVIDLSSLSFTKYPDYYNDDIVTVDEMLSDANIKAYMTLSQSFFVIVDKKEMFQYIYPVSTPFIGTALIDTKQYRRFPLIGSWGKTIEYHSRDEYGVTNCITTLNRRENYDYQYRPWKDQSAVDAKRFIEHPYRYPEVNIRHIGCDALTVEE